MAARGRGNPRPSQTGRRDGDDHVADLLHGLHLIEEEGEIAEWSDGDEEEEEQIVCALIGKVLSPMPVHANTILSAMKPAWGNPFGLKIRSVGEKGDNLFVAEFGHHHDRDRAIGGSPWMIGKYAVVLQEYDGRLKPSDISFEKMEMWVRILNLPLGWMNRS